MFTISMPRKLKPVFPDACVGCAVDRPGDRTRFFHFNGTSFFAVQVPVCRRCGPRVRRFLLWDNLRTLLIGGVSLWFGLFVLLLVGVMLLSEGGHLCELSFFGHPIEPMAKSTFYFVIIVLVLVDVAQGRYQRKLAVERKRAAGSA